LLGDPPDGGQRRRRSGPSRHLEPAKDKSTERIDGIVALIMAIGRAMLPQEPAPSYSMIILG
jgi:phage terminase large subunit-like protein